MSNHFRQTINDLMKPISAGPPRPPSRCQMEQAMSVLLSVRKRLLVDDPEIEADERLFSDMLEGEGGDAMAGLGSGLRAAVHAESMAEAAGERAIELKQREIRYTKRAEQLRGAAVAAFYALGMRRRE